MLSRRLFALSTLALFSMAFETQARSAFTLAAFEAAKTAGKPIIIEFHATWCPTCKAQAPVVESLAAQAEFNSFVVLRVDYDSQKDVRRSFDVRRQSTLIVYKGDREVGREVGITNEESIAELMRKAI